MGGVVPASQPARLAPARPRGRERFRDGVTTEYAGGLRALGRGGAREASVTCGYQRGDNPVKRWRPMAPSAPVRAETSPGEIETLRPRSEAGSPVRSR